MGFWLWHVVNLLYSFFSIKPACGVKMLTIDHRSLLSNAALQWTKLMGGMGNKEIRQTIKAGTIFSTTSINHLSTTSTFPWTITCPPSQLSRSTSYILNMSHNTSPLVRNVSANNSSRSSSRSVELLKSFRPLRVAPRKMPSDKEPSDSKKHHEGDESESSDDETYTPRSHSAFRSNKTAAIDDNCPDSDGDTGDESDGVQTAIRIYDEVDENLEEVVIHVRSLQLDTNVDTYPTVRKVQSASGHRVREFWYGPELKSQSPTWFKVLNSSNKTLSLPWQLFPPGVAVRYQKNLPRGYTIHEHATDLEIAEDMHTHANE